MSNTIKEKFHHLIDQISNENLENYYELIHDLYVQDQSSKDVLDELSQTQSARLNNAIDSANAKRLIDHEEALNRLK
ncbi:hypothetical protein [Marinoscillum furvescens]|uniref:Uncharacterized protein n=1 Tax=Marinoscillum furvescens DSM 4134 TaxID=1122208 RepID=A0A3D9L6T1_MARFU|nr:hypothetical protein [Marinoscillum furvescens]REE01058.1 hypothetical protein C7460_10477 [Marinoscillum furvescens DSM 4134]